MDTTRLISIQVGMPRHLGSPDAADPMDRPWHTGFFKEPVAGPVWLGRTNLAGDGQADLEVHGGPDKAVNAYSAEHYPAWREELGRPDMPYGAFGENFTLAGLTEDAVCIGDTYAMGEARVQVSQPRQPCWKLSRRWRIEDLAGQVQATGRTGWYFRVLVEGLVAPEMGVVLVERPFPHWTIARANRTIKHRRAAPEAAAELAACPLLSASWRAALRRRSLDR